VNNKLKAFFCTVLPVLLASHCLYNKHVLTDREVLGSRQANIPFRTTTPNSIQIGHNLKFLHSKIRRWWSVQSLNSACLMVATTRLRSHAGNPINIFGQLVNKSGSLCLFISYTVASYKCHRKIHIVRNSSLFWALNGRKNHY